MSNAATDTSGASSQTAQDLRLALVRETYRQRGGDAGFNEDWAFHQCAVLNNLGAPIGPSAPGSRLIMIGDHAYGYQPFALDTVVSESEQWYMVESLNALLGGAMPTSGLNFELLKASYAASGGGELHTNWAFHQLAVRERFGSPLAPSKSIPVAGQNYDIQVFACDTLCSPVGQPGNIRRLSALAPTDPLYESLWGETYGPCGQPYQSGSPFQQFAANAHLGAPLSGVYPLAGTSYQVQVFALDTLYMGVDNQIKRMSALPMPTFDNAPPELRAAFNFSTNPAPPPPATSIPPGPPPPPPVQAGNQPQVVQLALAQVGKPYVWGAAGPNSFDCSGLMLWCYKQLGVNLAHKASIQYTALHPVDRSQIRPGDLTTVQKTYARRLSWQMCG